MPVRVDRRGERRAAALRQEESEEAANLAAQASLSSSASELCCSRVDVRTQRSRVPSYEVGRAPALHLAPSIASSADPGLRSWICLA
jgi:hypothetical protein